MTKAFLLLEEIRKLLDKRLPAHAVEKLDALEWQLQEFHAKLEFLEYVDIWQSAALWGRDLPMRALTDFGFVNPWEYFSMALPYTAMVRDVEHAYVEDGIRDRMELDIELEAARALLIKYQESHPLAERETDRRTKAE